MRRSFLTAAAAIALALCAAAPAAADSGPHRVDRSDTFLTREPGQPTGLQVAIDYQNPANPDGKPPAVDTVIDSFNSGFRIDTGAPEQCTASSVQLIAVGAAACPAGSVVGTGEIDVDTGLVGPAAELRTAITFLNRTGELIMLVQETSTGVRTVIRGRVTNGDNDRITIQVRALTGLPLPLPGEPVDLGSVLSGHTDPGSVVPGSPYDGGAIRRERLLFPRLVRTVDGEQRSYLTTPPSCPSDGQWTNTSQYVFTDSQTSVVTDHTPCDGAGS